MTVNIPENYVSGGFAMEYEVPWMTPGAVRKLDELVRSTDRVIEVGTDRLLEIILTRGREG